MRALVIATIVDDKGKIIKYRLGRITLDVNANGLEKIDVTEYQLVYAIKTKQILVDNVKISNNKIIGDGASIDRYAKINCNTGRLHTDANPVVIIKQIYNNGELFGYLVCNYNGTVLRVRAENLIEYSKNYGIANGKVVSTGKSVFISPISGKYERVDMHIKTPAQANEERRRKEEEERKRREDEQRRIEAQKKAEEQKKLAEQRRLEEEERKRKEAEQKRLEEQRKAEEQKQKEAEQQKQVGLTLLTSNMQRIKYPTLAEFIKQREEDGLNTRINPERNTIIDLDSRDKILIIPEGIQYINNFYDSQDPNESGVSQLQLIILPSSWVMTSYALSGKALPHLKNVIYSDDTKEVSFNTFANLRPGEDKVQYNIPKHIERIKNLYNDKVSYVIPEIDLRGLDRLRDVEYSFFNCEVENPNINFGQASKLDYIFKYMKCKQPFHITIGENVSTLSGFEGLDVEEFNFDNATGLYIVVFGSIQKIRGLKRLDLSKCVKLIGIQSESFKELTDLEEVILPPRLERIDRNAFADCPKLKSIVIPDSLKSIGEGSFKNTGIGELELGPNITSIETKDDNLTIKVHGIGSLRGGTFQSVRLKKLILPDTLTVIGTRAFAGASIGELEIPSSIEIIKSGAFIAYKCTNENKVLDLSHCHYLKTIGDMAFENCELKGIALPDGLEEIGQRAFRNCARLQWMYVSQSVTHIGARALQNRYMDSFMKLTIYTQEGSAIDKYAKKNNVKVKYVNNVEEAFEAENTGTDARKLSKLRMMISNDPLNSKLLTDKKYEGREFELYNIHSTCTSPVEPIDLKLDTTNLISIPLQTVFNQDEIELLDREEPVQLTDRTEMIAYINFLSNVAPDFNKLVQKKNFDMFRDAGSNMVASFEYTYKCNEFSIAELRVNFDKSTFNIIFVIQRSNIIYCTAYNNDTVINNIELLPYEKTFSPVEKALVKEVAYPFTIGSTVTDMPKHIKAELSTVINEQWVLVGANGMRLSNNKIPSTVTSVGYALFLSLATGKIIKSNMLLNVEGLRQKNISTVALLDIQDYKDIPNKWKDDIQKLAFNQAGLDGLVPRMVLGGQYVDRLKLAPGAYDKYEECYEHQLGELLHSIKLNNIHNLNLQAMEAILQSAYFSPTRRKYSDIQKRFKERDNIDFGNGRYSLITYIPVRGKAKDTHRIVGGYPKFISLIKDMAESTKDNIMCYASHYTISTAINTIMGAYSPNCTTADKYLDNAPVVLEDYKIIYELTIKTNVIQSRPYLAVAIHKGTGAVFLLAGVLVGDYFKSPDDIKYYKLLRYKDLQSAIEATYWMDDGRYFDALGNGFLGADLHKDICEELYYLLSGDESVIRDVNQIHKVRQLVLNGYPNGYVMEGHAANIFQNCAKQSI